MWETSEAVKPGVAHAARIPSHREAISSSSELATLTEPQVPPWGQSRGRVPGQGWQLLFLQTPGIRLWPACLGREAAQGGPDWARWDGTGWDWTRRGRCRHI